MINSAANDPYLRVVSDFDAATTPAPSHRRALLTLLSGLISKVALAHCRPRPSSGTARAVHQGKEPHPIDTTRREDEVTS
jgi:hypothetical protein